MRERKKGNLVVKRITKRKKTQGLEILCPYAVLFEFICKTRFQEAKALFSCRHPTSVDVTMCCSLLNACHIRKSRDCVTTGEERPSDEYVKSVMFMRSDRQGPLSMPENEEDVVRRMC
jgi:hypothetical protein